MRLRYFFCFQDSFCAFFLEFGGKLYLVKTLFFFIIFVYNSLGGEYNSDE